MTFWEQLKNFFKDSSSGVFTKENYPGQLGIFNIGHIAFLCITAAGIVLVCLFRKTDYKKIRIYLQISAVVWIALEIFKMVRAVYFNGAGELLRQLPLQICSIHLYALAFSAWGKGKLKLIGDNFLASFGILAGFVGLTFTSMFTHYPFFHFNGLHTMFYHASMMLTGILLLTGKHVKLHYKNVLYPLLITCAVMLTAIIFNETGAGSNYIYLKTSQNTPVEFLGFLPHTVYILVVVLFMVMGNAVFYLPSFITEKLKARLKKNEPKPDINS